MSDACCSGLGRFQLWQQHDLFDLHRAAGRLPDHFARPPTFKRGWHARVSSFSNEYLKAVDQCRQGLLQLYTTRASLSAISDTSASDVHMSCFKVLGF
jgi:hypothetical protein